ncbi:MAG: disulfide bond formation protein B [Rhizobiales bacterium]|nr:disulfide bond formation protein B [Hyphomicrobiales bacterium]
MLTHITPQRAAFIVFAVTAATLVGAWLFEYYGYAPCELCLKQRWPYYVAIPFALALGLRGQSNPAFARNGLYVLVLVLLGSAIFGAYHAGVEWKWWAGPTTCSGAADFSSGLPDLTKPAVMCDEPALSILGLSLAGWNGVISLALAIVALKGARS